jgi:hypothetical protein
MTRQRRSQRRQQAAYRAIGRHPDWDAVTRPRIPPPLLEIYDHNVDARRHLTAMAHVKDTLPAWRIDTPPQAEELLGDYHEAESASGVGWNYLAAINLIETRFGSIHGRLVSRPVWGTRSAVLERPGLGRTTADAQAPCSTVGYRAGCRRRFGHLGCGDQPPRPTPDVGTGSEVTITRWSPPSDPLTNAESLPP